MLKRVLRTGKEIIITDEEISVFVITEKSDVAEYSDKQKESSLNFLMISLDLAKRCTNDIVADNTSHKEREEVRRAL